MKKWISLMLALVMALSLAACASGEQDLSTMVVERKEAESYKKEIAIALASQITTLDPGLISNVTLPGGGTTYPRPVNSRPAPAQQVTKPPRGGTTRGSGGHYPKPRRK